MSGEDGFGEAEVGVQEGLEGERGDCRGRVEDAEGEFELRGGEEDGVVQGEGEGEEGADGVIRFELCRKEGVSLREGGIEERGESGTH